MGRFKCNNKQPQMIGEYISALSNSVALGERPKVYLVWGVDDATHKIVGTEFQYRKMKKGNEELEARLSRMLSPRINFRFFEVPMDEGIVVLMEIPCAEKQPVQFAGGEYIRIGMNLRLSKDDMDDGSEKTESNSIANQRELLRSFVKSQLNIQIFDIYVDDGYSGGNFDRPEFKRMTTDIEAGRVNCVIVKGLSRFGREYIEAGQ